MHAINLDELKTLDEFRAAIHETSATGVASVIISQGNVLFTAVSPEETKELIARRIARKLADEPEALLEIQRRLETETPEEWEWD
jgi:hypothetical protein